MSSRPIINAKLQTPQVKRQSIKPFEQKINVHQPSPIL